jgi:elongation factor Tu
MPVEGVLSISGRGTVVTGAVERGVIRVGDAVDVLGLGQSTASVVTGIETFGKRMESAEAGDNAALLLRGVRRTDVRRGQVVAAQGSITPASLFTAHVYLLTADEGGRRTPIVSGYRPQFFVRTTDVVGELDLGELDLGIPGDRLDVTVRLGKPVPIEAGLGFAIREGGHTVGAGTVTTVLD